MKRFFAAVFIVGVFLMPDHMIPQDVGLWFYLVFGVLLVASIVTLVEPLVKVKP